MNTVAIKIAKDLRTIFDKNHDHLNDLGLPFFYSFPTNSCQGASVLLAYYFYRLFPEANTQVVLGSNRKRDENHYWVELDGKTFDITLDQCQSWLGDKYIDISKPIYESSKHPLRNYFFFKERYSAMEAFSIFCARHANIQSVIAANHFTTKKLKSQGWSFPSLEG